MGREFVLPDVHGGYKAVLELFNMVSFDFMYDKLIFLGDILDGWDEHDLIIDLFLKIKDFHFIAGNHDCIFINWLQTWQHNFNWSHGGENVIKAYERLNNENYLITNYQLDGFKTTLTPNDIPDSHKYFFSKAVTHYIDRNRNLFLHAGFNKEFTIDEHMPEMALDTFAWDGSLLRQAVYSNGITFVDDSFDRVFVGHTPVQNFNLDKPYISDNVIGMDTGSCFKGRLSMMDIDTMEVFQSSEVYRLYPHLKGRN